MKKSTVLLSSFVAASLAISVGFANVNEGTKGTGHQDTGIHTFINLSHPPVVDVDQVTVNPSEDRLVGSLNFPQSPLAVEAVGAAVQEELLIAKKKKKAKKESDNGNSDNASQATNSSGNPPTIAHGNDNFTKCQASSLSLAPWQIF